MAEDIALSKSTGFIDCGGCLGYFPYEAAKFLVGTSKYQYEAVCCWGYALKKKS